MKRQFERRHLGVVLATLLTAAGCTALTNAANTEEYIKGFVPYQNAQSSGYHVFKAEKRAETFLWNVGVFGGSLLGLGALMTVPINDDDEPLFDPRDLRADLPDTAILLAEAVNRAFAGSLGDASNVLFSQSKKAGRKLYTAIPENPVKNWLDTSINDQSWFKAFLKAPHNWVTGKTGAGKTYLTLALLSDWLESNPRGCVTICDLAYGGPNEAGVLNDWLGIKATNVKSSIEDVEAAVEAEWKECQRRKEHCETLARQGKKVIDIKFSKRLIIIDEWDTTVAEAGGKNSELLKNVKSLLKFSRKYGFKVILVGQTIATGDTDISEAVRNQLAILIAGRNATKTDEVAKLKAENTSALISSAKKLQQADKRPAIVQLEKEDPKTVVVPDLSYVNEIELIDQNSNELDQWWQEVCTPEKRKQAFELAERYVSGEIKSPLKSKILPLFGLSKPDGSDPKYIKYIRPLWEEAQEKAKQQLKEESKK
ncbi:MAG: ATP-binding protein [Elainellaceae cyanobacterium]